ncbi:hypothetical protein FB451DRAFT_1239107 [Mycena latifolia]|nr:hypothetical protein FB451DRAFT_1239107 [Mycena latifolia]
MRARAAARAGVPRVYGREMVDSVGEGPTASSRGTRSARSATLMLVRPGCAIGALSSGMQTSGAEGLYARDVRVGCRRRNWASVVGAIPGVSMYPRSRAGTAMCGRMALNSESERELWALGARRPRRRKRPRWGFMVMRVQELMGAETEGMERTEREQRREMRLILIGFPASSRITEYPGARWVRPKKLRALPIAEFTSASCSRHARISAEVHLKSASSLMTMTGPAILDDTICIRPQAAASRDF